MSTKSELLSILEQLEREKGLKKEEIIKLIEGAIVSAYKRQHGKDINVTSVIDIKTGTMEAYLIKEVVEDVTKPMTQISLLEAQKLGYSDIKVGEQLKIPLDVNEFSRIAAQTARQIVVQKIREKEKEAIVADYSKKIGEIVSGNVFKFIGKAVVVDLGKAEAILPLDEQIPGEKFALGKHIRALLLKIEDTPKGPRIILSRKNSLFVKKLFETEIPEIYEKIVEIVRIEREAGLRTKIIVDSKNSRVDAVGSCIGVKGARIKPIIDELNGEKIDLIHNTKDILKLIEESISPAKNIQINILSQEGKTAEIIVPDSNLSVAVGKYGHNIRLASRLTGWNLEVISESAKKQKEEEKSQEIKDEISKLKGIGKKTAEILKKAGFDSIGKIAKAKVEELTTLQGIGEKTAEKIISSAKEFQETPDNKISTQES